MKRCLKKSFENESNIEDLNDIPNIMCKYPLPQFMTDYYTFPKHINSIYNIFNSLIMVQQIRAGITLLILIALCVLITKI